MSLESIGKSTSTVIVVHGSSFCPVAHKMAAFNSMVHRLTRIPLSPSGFQKELMTMKHLARVNDVRVDIDTTYVLPWFELRQEGAVDQASVLTCSMSLFSPTPPLDDVTFGKLSFEKMSGGLRKNSEPLPRSWDLKKIRAPL